MEKSQTYEDVLEFALSKEREANRFYLALAQRVADPEMRKVLEQFAAEELEHRAKLEFELMKAGRVVKTESEPEDFDISAYIRSNSAELDMDYGDVLALAIIKEDAAYRIYIDLVPQARDEKARETLLAMAQEEVKHKLRFETERNKLLKRE
jgi:rubrerythrin